MSWSTHDEYEYIKHLGSHSAAGSRLKRLELLKMYKSLAKDRESWERIDEVFILNAVDDMIGELNTKLSKRHNVI